MFWNPLVISFPMGTGSLWFQPKMTEQFGFEVAYPVFKDSLQPDNDLGPLYSLDPIFSTIFGANHKVSVPIGKLMMRGFQNTPDF